MRRLIVGLVAIGSILLLFSTIFAVAIKHRYIKQLTGITTPAKGFARPWGLALDPSGNLLVADTGHSVVDMFNQASEYTTQLGSPLLFSEYARSVAIDDTTGDVYVADSGKDEVQVFKPIGPGKYEHIATWTGAKTELKEFRGELHVAVDNSSGKRKGDVYVMNARAEVINVFEPNPSGEEGKVVEEQKGPPGGFLFANKGSNEGLAVQGSTGPTAGDVYVVDGGKPESKKERIVEVFNDEGVIQPSLAPRGAETLAKSFGESGAAVGLDSSTGRVYVVDNEHKVVDEFNSSGESVGQIAGTCAKAGICSGNNVTPFGEALGVAVDNACYYHKLSGGECEAFDPSNGDVYISDGTNNVVDVFGPDIQPPAPSVAKQYSSDVTQTTAIMQAAINPEESNTTYHFEWGTTAAYGTSVPVPDATVGAGVSNVNVGQQITGLQPGTTYHFRVLATNSAATTLGEDQTFTTPPPAPPVVETGVASAVTQNGANVSGTVDPRGFHTTYEFDLGTDTSYGTRVFGDAGSSSGPETETVSLQGLAAGTTYHYRLLASNVFGRAYGADEKFTTPVFPTSVLAAPVAPALLPVPVIAFPTTAGDPAGKPSAHHRKKPKRKTNRKSRKATRAVHRHGKRINVR
jgi:hypothetical protein